MNLSSLKIKPVPTSPTLKNLLGPSFIILGLGLGSGEVILWPYLSSNYGLGIIWGAVLGITFQYFINMEISRYSLINGESIFVGFARKLKALPYWFLLSTFVPWIWPGIIASSATVLAHTLGIDFKIVAVLMLILIGLILSLGPILYQTVESFQKIVIGIGVPSIFVLSIFLASRADFTALGQGILGMGHNYNFLPIGIPIASFLAAFAYSGAGGNLNLAQSFYIKEKGYGMGKYASKISSLITGKTEEINLTGTTFVINETNLSAIKLWWKRINIEHFLIFWLTGIITILLLSLLAYSTVFGNAQNIAGINFVINESIKISTLTMPFVGTFFLLLVSLMLFATQMTVLDATTRIITENVLLIKNSVKVKVNYWYYSILWIQILTGILVFLFGISEPLKLLTISAVLNAFAMFVHTGLTLWVNKTLLHKLLQPSFLRITAIILAFLFYGGFSIYTLFVYLK